MLGRAAPVATSPIANIWLAHLHFTACQNSEQGRLRAQLLRQKVHLPAQQVDLFL